VDGAGQTVTLEEGYHKDEARLQITGQLDPQQAWTETWYLPLFQ